MSDQPTRPPNRQLAIGLALAAAACMLYAAFTQQWLVNQSRYMDVGFGLFGNHECTIALGQSDASACRERTNAEFVDAWRALGADPKLISGAFVPLGKVTFGLILLAAAGLLTAAGLALARKTPDLPVAPTTPALLGAMIGLVVGCFFVATKPGPPGMVGVGGSFWVFGAGCVAGIVGAQMLARVNRPPDPDWADDPIQPPPA